MVRWFRSWESS